MLKTARLDLVALDVERDLGALHAMFSDPAWARGGYMTPTASMDESRERLAGEFGDNGGWTWVLRVRPADDAAGVIGVFSDQGSSIRGMSWYLRRERWGAGLMSEAARAVVDHLLQRRSSASRRGSTHATYGRSPSRGTRAWTSSAGCRARTTARSRSRS
ncbi:GNAT family N-acetyltransferase [Kribbella sp. NPDC050459]|uniref:GNAT family N-acetyltransferase n=1 Tax=Kribbella sp. NPDC050459 TaxID=3155785 RepID=UPI0033F4B35A